MSIADSYLDAYIIVSTVWKGVFSRVKEVRCASTGSLFAAKIFHNGIPGGMAMNEITCMSAVSGPSVITVINANPNGIYRKKSGETYSCAYILMELCPNGNLFDIIYGIHSISQNLLKVIFMQILEALHSCHSTGICHRDIKPENILFDENSNIKLTDFGSSTRIQDMQRNRLPPGRYVAPEALRNNDYRGDIADIFSLGVLLFVMHTQAFPFFGVDSCDSLYIKFINDREEIWKLHGKRIDKQITVELRDLIENMLEPNPALRINLDGIRNHSWCSGVVVATQELQQEIGNRHRNNLAIAARQAENSSRYAVRPHGFRGALSSGELSLTFEEALLKSCKGSTCNKFTKIVSGLEPNVLLEKVHGYLVKNESECEVSKKYYRIGARIITDDDNLELDFTVYQDNEFHVLDIKMSRGDTLSLMKVVKDIQEIVQCELLRVV